MLQNEINMILFVSNIYMEYMFILIYVCKYTEYWGKIHKNVSSGYFCRVWNYVWRWKSSDKFSVHFLLYLLFTKSIYYFHNILMIIYQRQRERGTGRVQGFMQVLKGTNWAKVFLNTSMYIYFSTSSNSPCKTHSEWAVTLLGPKVYLVAHYKGT